MKPKVKFVSTHLAVAIVCVCAGILLGSIIFPRVYVLDVTQPTTVSQATYNAEVTAILNGEEAWNLKKHNTYMDIGKTFERDLKAFGNVTQNATYGVLGWCSLSDDASPDVEWTQLPNEENTAGATRKVWDSLTVINYTSFNGTVTFTFTDTITLQCAGIQWDETSMSDNNLYACFSFTQTTFNADDQLIIKYYNTESGT